MESFNGRFKGEGHSLFLEAQSLGELVAVVDERMRYSNTERRHSSAGYVPPLMYIERARSKGEDRTSTNQAVGSVDSHKKRSCPHYSQPYDDGDDAPLLWVGALGTLPEEDHNKHSLKWYNFLGELPTRLGCFLSRSTIEPTLPQVSEKGVLQSPVDRQVIKVFGSRGRLELDARSLIPGVQEESVTHDPASKDQGGIVDDAHIGIGYGQVVRQVSLEAQRELELLEGGEARLNNQGAMSTSLEGVVKPVVADPYKYASTTGSRRRIDGRKLQSLQAMSSNRSSFPRLTREECRPLPANQSWHIPDRRAFEPKACARTLSCSREERRQTEKKKSGRRDLNPRQPAWKAGALPLRYSRSEPIISGCPPQVKSACPHLGARPRAAGPRALQPAGRYRTGCCIPAQRGG